MIIAYIFTGEEERDENGNHIIPSDATHVSIDESVRAIPANLFDKHPNIVELICHDGVIKIECWAFWKCTSLRRVKMRGVKVFEGGVFIGCEAVTDIECPKLEIIGGCAFMSCKSLSSIDLTSVKVVEDSAFHRCEALTEAKFGKDLESVGCRAFVNCRSLERITIPLKNGLFTRNSTFQGCANLKRVDLVEEAILHGTVAALLLEEWRNDMNAEIDSINQILPNAPAGYYDFENDIGEKAIAIREWIGRLIDEIINCKVKHRRLVGEAASTLQLALPNDIVTNYVVPFLELPLHKFDGEGEDEDEDEDEYTFDSEEDNGVEEDNDEDDSHDQLQDESVADDREDDEAQQQQDDEGGRKRRKTTKNDDEEVS